MSKYRSALVFAVFGAALLSLIHYLVSQAIYEPTTTIFTTDGRTTTTSPGESSTWPYFVPIYACLSFWLGRMIFSPNQVLEKVDVNVLSTQEHIEKAVATIFPKGYGEFNLGQATLARTLAYAIQSAQGGSIVDARYAALKIEAKEQKAELVQTLFSEDTGAVEVCVEAAPESVFVWVTITRSISRLTELERYLLRSLFKLYLYGFIDHRYFNSQLASIIYADGKGETGEVGTQHQSLEQYTVRPEFEKSALEPHARANAYRIPFAATEFTTMIFNGHYQSSVTAVINTIEQLALGHPDNSVIKGIRAEMNTAQKNFLSAAEVPGTIFEASIADDHSLYFGMMGDAKTPLCYNSNESVITIAPPGSGKTQAFVIQNLLRYKGSCVVLDVKGELYESTAGYRSRFTKVYKLNIFADPADPKDQTDAFNPFDQLPSEVGQLWEEALFVAEMMVVPLSTGDTFWDSSAQDILRFAIAAMVLDEKNTDRSIDYILDTIASRKDLDEAKYVLENTGYRPAVRAAARLNDLGSREAEGGSNMLSSILQTLATGLRNLEGERVANATKRSDWTPESLRDEPTTVYIVLKPGAGQQYAPLIRLILGQHLRALTPQNPPSKLTPILFMLDEMPDLGYMRPIEKALDMGRGYALRLWMFAQDTAQIGRCYQNAGAFIGKCAIQIYMDCSLADGTAENISRAIGIKKSLVDDREELAVRPEQLAGAEYADKAIVFGRGSKPAVVTKAMAFRNPKLVELMRLPPPK